MRNRRRVLRELALATLAGTVMGLSPLVPKHWAGSLAAGLATGGVVLGVRLLRAPREDEATAEERRWVVPPAAAASLVLWVALFAPTWLWLYHHWTGSVWSNEHGLFIPFVVAWLVMSSLRNDPTPFQEESSPWGFVWVGLGGALALLDSAAQTGYLATLGLLASLPGISLVLLGARRTRMLAVPLAVALLMMPVPRTLATELHLRHVTAVGVENVLLGFGFTFLREGTVLHLPRRLFIVSDACSGFATLYAAFAMAIILASQVRGVWRRALLLLAAAPLAILANVARVSLLVVLTTRFGDWVIDSAFHPATGVATFVFVLLGLGVIARGRGWQARPA